VFLRFQGPTTILIQSRTRRIADIITKKEVEDISITEPETLAELEKRVADLIKGTQQKPKPTAWSPTATKAATVIDGKVTLEDSDLSEFVGGRSS